MGAKGYRLVVDGKYDRGAIMIRAWEIIRRDKRVYGEDTSLSYALRQAWRNAHFEMELSVMEMKRREAGIKYPEDPDFKPANDLREFLYRPEYRYYDSTWR